MNGNGTMIRCFDYDRRLIPNPYVARMDEGVSDIAAAIARTGHTVGYPGWNLLYYAVYCALDRHGPNILVETGTNLGFSAIMMAQALKDSRLDGHVYTVELDPRLHAQACANIEQAGVSALVTPALGAAEPFLGRLVAELDGTVRFVFLDGSHLQRDVIREFELLHPKLADDSTVFFDNTCKPPGDGVAEQRVNGALRFILRTYGGNLLNFPNSSWSTPGQAIWQRAPFSKDWTATP